MCKRCVRGALGAGGVRGVLEVCWRCVKGVLEVCKSCVRAVLEVQRC